MDFQKLLKVLNACGEAVKWCEGKTLPQAWSECQRADWMLWLCSKMIEKNGWPDRKTLVLAACLCAETALKFWEKKHPTDKRPHISIETARKWAGGEATIDEVKAAAAAAYAAAAAVAYASDAADAAADAAYAAAASDADAAASAAAYAAAAYAYAADAAFGPAKIKALAKLAEIIRKLLQPEEVASKDAIIPKCPVHGYPMRNAISVRQGVPRI